MAGAHKLPTQPPAEALEAGVLAGRGIEGRAGEGHGLLTHALIKLSEVDEYCISFAKEAGWTDSIDLSILSTRIRTRSAGSAGTIRRLLSARHSGAVTRSETRLGEPRGGQLGPRARTALTN